MRGRDDEISPELIKLDGERIVDIIEGNMIGPHPDVDQNHYPFAEYFYPLGYWKSVRSTRANYWSSGEWYVESDRLMVKKDENIYDREVWIDSRTGNIAIVDMLSGFNVVLIMKISVIVIGHYPTSGR